MRTLPIVYSQRDALWAAQRLGTVNGATIGQYGCFLSCDAMLAGYYGHTITPAALDDLYTNRGIYTDGDLLTDPALDLIYPDIPYQTTEWYLTTPADLNHLKNLLSDPSISVILEIDFDYNPNDGIQTHFVVALDCDGTNVTIADPWYGTINKFSDHYGNNPSQTILKFVVYKGNVTQTMQVDPQKFTELVTKSTNCDTIAQYTKIDALDTQMGAKVVKLIQDTTKERDGLQTTVNEQKLALDKLTLNTQAQIDGAVGKVKADYDSQITQLKNDMRLECGTEKQDLQKTIDDLMKNGVVKTITFETTLKDRFHNKPVGVKIPAAIEVLLA